MGITVCDSIMGSGKTQAAIRHMSLDTDHRYLFVTPYLDEVDRIVESCPNRNFKAPSPQGAGKLGALNHLLELKCNIASTHALFKLYTEETVALIEQGNYKLILDEVLDIIELVTVDPEDLAMIRDHNWLTVDEETFQVTWTGTDTYGGTFKKIRQLAEHGQLCLYEDQFIYWLFPMPVFKAFKEVTILTYLFDSQVLKYYFDLHNEPLKKIYTKRLGEGEYEFSDVPCPEEYVSKLIDKVHILHHDKLNAIGDDYFSLSSTWYSSRKRGRIHKDIKKMHDNLSNLYTNIFKGKAENRMWTCFKDSQSPLCVRGTTKAFVTCNIRASNDYRERTQIAYCLNVFHVPQTKNFFIANKIAVREDDYALCEMIQFLWRSAIRDGKDIWVYVPSRRMRTLLENWLLRLSETGIG